MHYDLNELETEVAAVYAAQLPIPPWWPDEERAAFIADHAGDAFGALTTQLNDVVDREIDQAARSASANGRSYSADEISVLIDIGQETLIEEARSGVQYDLSEEIAHTSATLLTELLLERSQRDTGPALLAPHYQPCYRPRP